LVTTSPSAVPVEDSMLGEVLPAVRNADEARRALQPRRGAAQRERAIRALCEQHRNALVIPDPCGVARAAVGEVRGDQHVQMVIVQRAGSRGKDDPLQEHLSMRIGEDLLFDAVAAGVA
jgi:hypothetical protein